MVFLCKAISIDRFWGGGGGGGGGALLLNFLFQNSVPIIREKNHNFMHGLAVSNQ